MRLSVAHQGTNQMRQTKSSENTTADRMRKLRRSRNLCKIPETKETSDHSTKGALVTSRSVSNRKHRFDVELCLFLSPSIIQVYPDIPNYKLHNTFQTPYAIFANPRVSISTNSRSPIHCARPQLNAVPTAAIVRQINSIAKPHFTNSSVCSAGVLSISNCRISLSASCSFWRYNSL